MYDCQAHKNNFSFAVVASTRLRGWSLGRIAGLGNRLEDDPGALPDGVTIGFPYREREWVSHNLVV